MFEKKQYSGSTEQDYKLVIRQLEALSDGETDPTALLANASALLNQFLDGVNWVGFYITRGEELVLGPFQGLPACIRIPFGKGVCGTAAVQKETLLVDDVHAFPGHIACDSATNSEIVVPIVVNGSVYGVLDIDSPVYSRFSVTDKVQLTAFIRTLETYLK